MTVGVLALQGDFAAHAHALERAGHRVILLRSRADFAVLAAGDSRSPDAHTHSHSLSRTGLVLPGGESSSMLRLLDRLSLWEPLQALRGVPVLATCAGLIVLARQVEPAQRSLGWLDIAVERNGYGRQLHSFEASVAGRSLVFIRAPRVTAVGDGIEVMLRCRGDAVLVRQGPIVAATFHPELSGDGWLIDLAFAPGARGAPGGVEHVSTPEGRSELRPSRRARSAAS